MPEKALVVALDRIDSLPLRTRTPIEWGYSALSDPIRLLIDHAFLEMKAANNAMELMTRWPGTWMPGWVETMTGIAKDEAAHLSQVTRLLIRRGGHMDRGHQSSYARALRALVRKGVEGELLDRLMVSALIEARSCERFGILAAASTDEELASFYNALFSSELGHYKAFLKLAGKVSSKDVVDARWNQMLDHEARILGEQPPGPRIHSGLA